MLLFCLLDSAHVLLSVLVNGSPRTHNVHILVHARLEVQFIYIWVLLFVFFEKCQIIMSPILHLGPQDAIIRNSYHVPYVSYPCSPQFCQHLAFHLLAILGSVGLAKLHVAVGTFGLSQERFLPYVLQSLVCYLRKGLQGAQESAHIQK